jgi:hypothetical protein
MSKRILLTFLCSSLLACAPFAATQDEETTAKDQVASAQQCRFVRISVNHGDAEPMAINDAGTIAGNYFPQGLSVGFVLQSGKIKTVSFPGALFTLIFGISDTGVVVGDYGFFDTAPPHGFAYFNGHFVPIDVPGAVQTDARAVNRRGQIVGDFGGNAMNSQHGFLLSGGKFHRIDFPGKVNTFLTGINDSGMITGEFQQVPGCTTSCAFDSFELENGHFTIIGLPHSRETDALGINDFKTKVGDVKVSNNVTMGFVLKKGKFRTFSRPNFSSTFFNGINSSGVIVGSAFPVRSGSGGFAAFGCTK